jgi:hypothetical protein
MVATNLADLTDWSRDSLGAQERSGAPVAGGFPGEAE